MTSFTSFLQTGTWKLSSYSGCIPKIIPSFLEHRSSFREEFHKSTDFLMRIQSIKILNLSLLKLQNTLRYHCVKYHNFTQFSCVEILWKGTIFTQSRANHPKLCIKCAFPESFHTRKLGEITVFYALHCSGSVFYIVKTL